MQSPLLHSKQEEISAWRKEKMKCVNNYLKEKHVSTSANFEPFWGWAVFSVRLPNMLKGSQFFTSISTKQKKKSLSFAWMFLQQSSKTSFPTYPSLIHHTTSFNLSCGWGLYFSKLCQINNVSQKELEFQKGNC